MICKLLNYGLFQVGWFACVLAGAHGMTGVAVVAAGAVIAVSLWCFNTDRASDLRLFFAVTLIGFCMDTLNLQLRVFSLNGSPRFPQLCPLWLLAMWSMFAATLRGSLSWLAGRYGLAALLGAVGGTLSYHGGARFGAVTMHPNRAFSVAVLALGWALVTPILFWLAHGSRLRTGTAGEQG